MPEWSIGPHSKCGERVTVPGVRIPLFPHFSSRLTYYLWAILFFKSDNKNPNVFDKPNVLPLAGIAKARKRPEKLSLFKYA